MRDRLRCSARAYKGRAQRREKQNERHGATNKSIFNYFPRFSPLIIVNAIIESVLRTLLQNIYHKFNGTSRKKIE